MMKHPLLVLLLFLFTIGYTQAQATINGSFIHDGITRTYSFYVPAAYVPGQPVPLLIDLHGFSSDGAAHNLRSDFGPIADTANFIVAHPDGTIEPFTSQRFWNYGSVLGSTVDDVGFLVALIDTISAHYSVNQNRVYCSGMSNGSYMSYYMACETDRFAAVGAVTGSMGTTMYNNCNPAHPTPTIHVHGTTDPINPYGGNGTSKGIHEVSIFWAQQNGCDTIPVITPIADINTTDDATAERYLYSGGINGHTVEHFKVIDGGHTWPGHYIFTFNGNTCMDFDASKELWRFFSQYEKDGEISIQENPNQVELIIAPNPTQGDLYIQAKDQVVTDLTIIDMQGSIIEKHSKENIQHVDLGHLKPGNYIVKISGKNFYVIKKLIISSRGE